MIHMHNALSSAADSSTAGTTKPPVSQATLNSFRNALSDAVSSTLEKFGIDPNQVQVSVTPTPSVPPHPPATPPGPAMARREAPLKPARTTIRSRKLRIPVGSAFRFHRLPVPQRRPRAA